MPTAIAFSILRRLVDPDLDDLSSDAAQAVLRLRLAEVDQTRMGELADKSNLGTLTPEEADEYDAYIAAADFLSLWKSKARLSLKHHPSAA